MPVSRTDLGVLPSNTLQNEEVAISNYLQLLYTNNLCSAEASVPGLLGVSFSFKPLP